MGVDILAQIRGRFQAASVVLPVINETLSLERTIEIIESSCGAEVGEYLVVVCSRTTDDSRVSIAALGAKLGPRWRVLDQTLPFLGGAVREAFRKARCSHTVMMSSDLETDPALVSTFIRLCKEHPESIITASRWIGDGGFVGYNPVKLVCNLVFQAFFSALYRTRLSDLTYGFRIFPTPLLQAIEWEELRHTFLFETALKPLLLGVGFREVPARWTSRNEGESQNSFFLNFQYLATGLRLRLRRRETLLRKK